MNKYNENLQRKIDTFVKFIYDKGFSLKIVGGSYWGDYVFFMIEHMKYGWTVKHVSLQDCTYHNCHSEFYKSEPGFEIDDKISGKLNRNQALLLQKLWLDVIDISEFVNGLKIPMSFLSSVDCLGYFKRAGQKINRRIKIEIED